MFALYLLHLELLRMSNAKSRRLDKLNSKPSLIRRWNSSLRTLCKTFIHVSSFPSCPGLALRRPVRPPDALTFLRVEKASCVSQKTW